MLAAHAGSYIHKLLVLYKHNTNIGYTNPMNANHCLTVRSKIEVAKFKSSADKTPIQRCFWYVCHPLYTKGYDGANLRCFSVGTLFFLKKTLLRIYTKKPWRKFDCIKASLVQLKNFDRCDATTGRTKNFRIGNHPSPTMVQQSPNGHPCRDQCDGWFLDPLIFGCFCLPHSASYQGD